MAWRVEGSACIVPSRARCPLARPGSPFPRQGAQVMGKTIGSVILGYLVMVVVVFATFSLAIRPCTSAFPVFGRRVAHPITPV